MTVFSQTINGTATSPSRLITTKVVKQGIWDKNRQHSFGDLTECPCGYLDRFTTHGNRVREAYENAVVKAIRILSGKPIVNVAVIGSGGLLQEAIWLTKLYQEKNTPFRLFLHLVDTSYSKDDKRVIALANYVNSIVREGTILDICAWKSCDDLTRAAAARNDLTPDLVIGMDTECATRDAKTYQWELLPGDVEKTLLVKWKIGQNGASIRIFSRRGSNVKLPFKEYDLKDARKAAECIENAANIGV